MTWSVAEGRRGRRWREVVSAGQGRVVSSLLLELDRDGRFSHLELSTSSGLLTLHPEPDGTLHGNAITRAGVRHVRGLPWERDGAIVLEGSVICRAVATSHGDRGGPQVELWIGLDLGLERRAARAGPSAATATGLPDLLDGTTWPLEEEPGSSA